MRYIQKGSKYICVLGKRKENSWILGRDYIHDWMISIKEIKFQKVLKPGELRNNTWEFP